jgi:hypothetical protein
VIFGNKDVVLVVFEIDLQQTDGLIVNIVNDKLGLAQPLTENDINRSHIIGPINNGKGQLIPTFRFDCVVYLLHVLDRRILGES